MGGSPAPFVYVGPARVRVLAVGVSGADLLTEKELAKRHATQDRLNKGLRRKALQARLQPKAKSVAPRKHRAKTWRSDTVDYHRPRRTAPKMTKPR